MVMITGLWEISVFGVTATDQRDQPRPKSLFQRLFPPSPCVTIVLGSLPLVTLTLHHQAISFSKTAVDEDVRINGSGGMGHAGRGEQAGGEYGYFFRERLSADRLVVRRPVAERAPIMSVSLLFEGTTDIPDRTIVKNKHGNAIPGSREETETTNAKGVSRVTVTHNTGRSEPSINPLFSFLQRPSLPAANTTGRRNQHTKRPNSSFILATHSIDGKAHFVNLAMPLRSFTGEGAGTTHLGRRIQLAIRTPRHLHRVDPKGPCAVPYASVRRRAESIR